MKEPKSIIIFNNGNLAVFDDQGGQIPELQKSWIDFDQIKATAKMIASGVEVEGTCPYLDDYVRIYCEHPDLD